MEINWVSRRVFTISSGFGTMGDAYPDLITHQDKICKVLKQEEIQFSKHLIKAWQYFRIILLQQTQ